MCQTADILSFYKYIHLLITLSQSILRTQKIQLIVTSIQIQLTIFFEVDLVIKIKTSQPQTN